MVHGTASETKDRYTKIKFSTEIHSNYSKASTQEIVFIGSVMKIVIQHANAAGYVIKLDVSATLKTAHNELPSCN